MIRRLFAFCLICLFAGFGAFAQSDSIASRSSIFIIPHASYQQETNWAPGVAYGYYFKSEDISRISSVSGSAVYTFRHQFIFNTTPKLYFAGNKWYLYSNLNFRNYPDYYYGIGNNNSGIEEPFTSKIISVLLQPQYGVTKKLFVGANISVRFEDVKANFTSEEIKQNIYNLFGETGWMPYHQTNLGLVVSYDSRDNSFYPYQGAFAKMTYSASQSGFGSTHSLQQIAIDLRKYVPFFKEHVLAVQIQFEGIFGQNGIPFQLLPTIGGADLLRGFRQGKYKENMMMVMQAEYRLPIYKRFKAALFCATGDVFDSNNFQMSDKMKIAYGAGLRCRVNDARVHIRFDVAKNNYSDKLQFYITATEAF